MFLFGMDASLIHLKPLVLEKTEGTPFFMEEVVQTLAEEGALSGERGHYRLETTPTELHISPTVQGVLAARIDRLSSDEKELLQQLSVIGRQFPVSLVKAVVSQTEDELYQILASLQAKEFLYEQPAFPESEYLFKHALTQDVAYGTVLHEQRKALHERTGQAMEVLYKENLEEHCSELAYHFSQSGNAERTVEYLRLAGQQAIQRFADVDAVRHLTLALGVLATLPASAERDQHELALQLALGIPLANTHGWSSPELERAYSQARVLGQKLGDTSQLIPVLWGQFAAYLMRAKYTQARDLADQLLDLAQRTQDTALLVVTGYAVGAVLFNLGERVVAREHFKRGIALYEADSHYTLVFQYFIDPKVACLAYLAWDLWLSGYPAQSLKRAEEALVLARNLSHSIGLAGSRTITAHLYQCLHQVPICREQTEALSGLITEHDFAQSYVAQVDMLQGWVLTQEGQGEEGLAHLRRGLATWREVGAEIWRPYYLALLAEGYARAEQPMLGLTTVAEALDVVRETGERFYEAELYRQKGALLLQSQDNHPEAEACFQQALEVARRQEAKSLELRAATSLARLWQGQGKTNEAHDLLAPVHNWFTEGFDTADLKDAKALVEQLSEGWG